MSAGARGFHDRIYRGEIVQLGSGAVAALTSYAAAFVEEAFAPYDPREIHRHYEEAALADGIARVRRSFGRAAETASLWRAVFESAGLDACGLARDRLHLRFQPHRAAGEGPTRSRATATLAFHRDSWGSNLYAQVNWWAPVYPVTPGRTLALYPALWNRPVRNSSAVFDIKAVLADDTLPAAALLPRLLEEVDPLLASPVVIAPGTLIAFSAAHAHAGIANHTGTTRISLETRTVWIDDVREGRGAPNVDGAAPWMTPGFFRRVTDGRGLDAILGVDRIAPFDGARSAVTPSTDTTRTRSG